MDLDDVMAADAAPEVNLPGEDDLGRVSRLATYMLQLTDQITGTEETLKDLRRKLAKVQTEDLPELMSEIGLAGFTLENGKRLEIQEVIAASITRAKEAEAFDWCREHGHAGIIKNVVTAAFGKGEDDEAHEILEQLEEELGAGKVSQKESIHASTLKSWAKELLAKGDAGELPEEECLPEELFGIYRGKKAVVK